MKFLQNQSIHKKSKQSFSNSNKNHLMKYLILQPEKPNQKNFITAKDFFSPSKLFSIKTFFACFYKNK